MSNQENIIAIVTDLTVPAIIMSDLKYNLYVTDKRLVAINVTDYLKYIALPFMIVEKKVGQPINQTLGELLVQRKKSYSFNYKDLKTIRLYKYGWTHYLNIESKQKSIEFPLSNDQNEQLHRILPQIDKIKEKLVFKRARFAW